MLRHVRLRRAAGNNQVRDPLLPHLDQAAQQGKARRVTQPTKQPGRLVDLPSLDTHLHLAMISPSGDLLLWAVEGRDVGEARQSRGQVDTVVGWGAGSSSVGGRSSTRRRSWALRATTMVETLIKMAATAGGMVIPAQMRAPAAMGMATTL